MTWCHIWYTKTFCVNYTNWDNSYIQLYKSLQLYIILSCTQLQYINTIWWQNSYSLHYTHNSIINMLEYIYTYSVIKLWSSHECITVCILIYQTKHGWGCFMKIICIESQHELWTVASDYKYPKLKPRVW